VLRGVFEKICRSISPPQSAHDVFARSIEQRQDVITEVDLYIGTDQCTDVSRS
jgi:hypothetical protein